MKRHKLSEYKQSFGLVSKEYKKYRGEYNAKLFANLFSLLRVRKGESISILDLGCGVGNSTEPLFRMGMKRRSSISIVGCDIDARMIREARAGALKAKLPATYVIGKAEKLPFKREQFDLVISGAAFHWFATKTAMKEVYRVLKPGAAYAVFWIQNVSEKNVVFGQELYRKYKWQGIPRDLRNPKNVKKILIENGFMKVSIMKIPNTERRSMEETLGLIKTNSSYALLSPADKKIFIQEMRREYRKVLGNKTDTVWQEFNVCYGRKAAND